MKRHRKVNTVVRMLGKGSALSMPSKTTADHRARKLRFSQDWRHCNPSHSWMGAGPRRHRTQRNQRRTGQTGSPRLNLRPSTGSRGTQTSSCTRQNTHHTYYSTSWSPRGGEHGPKSAAATPRAQPSITQTRELQAIRNLEARFL